MQDHYGGVASENIWSAALSKVAGRTKLKFEELTTHFVENESVNCQPITFIYDHLERIISHALTSAHLVYRVSGCYFGIAANFETVSTNKSLTKRVKNQQHRLAQLINCWQKQCLLSLCKFRGVRLKG